MAPVSGGSSQAQGPARHGGKHTGHKNAITHRHAHTPTREYTIAHRHIHKLSITRKYTHTPTVGLVKRLQLGLGVGIVAVAVAVSVTG